MFLKSLLLHIIYSTLWKYIAHRLHNVQYVFTIYSTLWKHIAQTQCAICFLDNAFSFKSNQALIYFLRRVTLKEILNQRNLGDGWRFPLIASFNHQEEISLILGTIYLGSVTITLSPHIGWSFLWSSLLTLSTWQLISQLIQKRAIFLLAVIMSFVVEKGKIWLFPPLIFTSRKLKAQGYQICKYSYT